MMRQTTLLRGLPAQLEVLTLADCLFVCINVFQMLHFLQNRIEMFRLQNGQHHDRSEEWKQRDLI